MSWRGPVTGLVAGQALGILWYSPSMFGPRWMKMVHPGKQLKDVRASSGGARIVALVGQAALAGVLNHVYVEYMGVANWLMAIRAGMLVSGVCATTELPHMMFGDKPWSLFAINQVYNTVLILTISIGIGAFL